MLKLLNHVKLPHTSRDCFDILFGGGTSMLSFDLRVPAVRHFCSSPDASLAHPDDPKPVVLFWNMNPNHERGCSMLLKSSVNPLMTWFFLRLDMA